MPGSVLREHLLFFREKQCVRMMVAGAGVGRCGGGATKVACLVVA